MRVLTINALVPEYADGPRRRANLRQGLRRLEPDVIAFHEVMQDEVRGCSTAGGTSHRPRTARRKVSARRSPGTFAPGYA